MKRALQAILIAPNEDERRNILSGEKTATIREGHRDYTQGPALIGCDIEPWCVRIDIDKVRLTTINEVTPEEYRADGYSSPEKMINNLRTYYPNINKESDVTVIEWSNIRGKLVDSYRNNF